MKTIQTFWKKEGKTKFYRLRRRVADGKTKEPDGKAQQYKRETS